MTYLRELRLAGLACALALTSALAWAYQPVALAPGQTLHIDADLSKPVWTQAPVWDDFWQYIPADGVRPSQRTTVQVAYDARAVFFAIRAYEQTPAELRTPLVRRDGVSTDQDFVAVYLDAIGRNKSALFVRVSAAGVVGDGVYSADTQSEDLAPDFEVDAAARRLPDGYAVELRIPFSALRFDPGSQAPWQFLVLRTRPREQTEVYASVPLKRGAPNLIGKMLPLEGLSGPAVDSAISWRPSVALHRQRDSSSGQPDVQQHSQRLSLEAKWQPDAHWVVDMALRPDFSQVELDVPQLSSNAQYALSLTEKRPFMLESSDTLQTPSRSGDLGGGGPMAVYTRSITQMRSGVRATRRDNATEFTTWVAQDEGGGVVLVPGPYGTGTVAQPANRVELLRAKSHSDDLTLGGLLAHKTYAGLGSNLVLGPDLVWHANADDTWRVQALGSSTTALARGAGGLAAGPAQTGSYVFADWVHRSDTLEPQWEYEQVSSGFRNDSGFVPQSGYRALQGQVLGKITPGGDWREIDPYLWALVSQSLSDGATLQRVLEPGVFMLGPRHISATVGFHPDMQWRAQPGGTLHHLHQWYVQFNANPAPWFSTLNLSGNLGQQVDLANDRVAKGYNGTLNAKFYLLDRLELEPRLDRSYLQAPNGRRSLADTAVQLLAVWHLDANQSLRLIQQWHTSQRLAWLAGDAASQDSRSRVSSLTYGWRWSVLRSVWLGLTRANNQALGGPDTRSTEVFAKMSWDFGR